MCLWTRWSDGNGDTFPHETSKLWTEYLNEWFSLIGHQALWDFDTWERRTQWDDPCDFAIILIKFSVYGTEKENSGKVWQHFSVKEMEMGGCGSQDG